MFVQRFLREFTKMIVIPGKASLPSLLVVKALQNLRSDGVLFDV